MTYQPFFRLFNAACKYIVYVCTTIKNVDIALRLHGRQNVDSLQLAQQTKCRHRLGLAW